MNEVKKMLQDDICYIKYINKYCIRARTSFVSEEEREKKHQMASKTSRQ